jgi:hypothetical protein
MSETTRTPESTKRATDQAGRAAKEATEQAARNGAGQTQVKEAAQDVAQTVVEAAAGVGSQVVDIGLDRGHRIVSSAMHAMDIYREASERSTERVNALFSSAMTLSRGLQTLQHAWLEIVDQTMEQAAHKPRDLLRCKTIVEVAEVQRDLYLDAVNHAFESTSRLLEMAGRTAQDAVRPLRS